jgi:transposase
MPGKKALFAQGITEAGCLADARRKLHELWPTTTARWPSRPWRCLPSYAKCNEVARLPTDERLRMRQLKAGPAADALQAWLLAQRQKVPAGSATAKAIDYSLGRWQALVAVNSTMAICRRTTTG